MIRLTQVAALMLLLLGTSVVSMQSSRKPIQHDAEHYMSLEQHGERWAKEDAAVSAKLDDVRNANGGKPPNILFVLIDNVGFGESGGTVLNHVRGYTTPNNNALAWESTTFFRMHFKPTRTVFLSGRLPVRSHVLDDYKTIGAFPIMHPVAVRRDFADANPKLPAQFDFMYRQAKQADDGDLKAAEVLKTTLPWVNQGLEETRILMGDHDWKYGIAAHRKELDLVMRYTYEQG